MEKEILNLQEVCVLLEVGEKTMLKLLREESIPARKIGREWRMSKKAIIDWIAAGVSSNYNISEPNISYSEYKKDNFKVLIEELKDKLDKLSSTNAVDSIIKDMDKNIEIPKEVTLDVSYKQKKGMEKVGLKFYWPIREE